MPKKCILIVDFPFKTNRHHRHDTTRHEASSNFNPNLQPSFVDSSLDEFLNERALRYKVSSPLLLLALSSKGFTSQGSTIGAITAAAAATTTGHEHSDTYDLIQAQEMLAQVSSGNSRLRHFVFERVIPTG